MRNKLGYFLIILALFCTSCSAKTKSDQPIEADKAKIDSSTGDLSNMPLEQGIYYAYRSCKSKNMTSSYTCKQGLESQFIPNQDGKGNFVIDFGKDGKTDEFYLIHHGNSSSIYFSYTVVEGWAVGWAPAKITEKNNYLLVEGDRQIQTDGVPVDGDESTDINRIETKAKRVVGENTSGHKVSLKYSFNFKKLNSSEFVLNCKEYTNKENNQPIDSFSPLTNLCEKGVAQIWFRKIADISNAHRLSMPSVSENTQKLPSNTAQRFDFNNYPVQIIFSGKRHEAIITEKNKNMRTRLSKLVREPVAFAGHYAVERVGCGFDCVFYLIVDVQTGMELEFANLGDVFPALMRCEGENIDNYIDVKPHSRLLIAYGREADGDLEDGSCMARYYEEKSGKLYLLEKQKLNTSS